jgi:osmotically-inducible protein OsmY
MMNKQLTTMTAIAALAASMAMAGCSPQDQANAKNATRDAVATAKQDAKEAGAEASKGMDQAKDAVVSSAREAKDAATTAGEKIGDKVDDAMITASVKAELAKDAGLSALKINVDTDHGRVALRGTAGSAAARDRALALAGGVKGVLSVDNQLTLEAGKS